MTKPVNEPTETLIHSCITPDERVRLQYQFQNRHRFMTAGSIFLLLLGILSLVSAFFLAASEDFLFICCLACAVSGAGMIASGVWALRVSGKHEADFTGAKIVVYESKLGLFLGWLLYIIGAVLSVVVIVLAVDEDGGSMIVSLLTLLLFFGWAACASDYRNRRILMNDSRVWGVTAFGKNWCFSKSEIDKVGLQLSVGGFSAKDFHGKTLFRFENNMIHSKELFQALGGTLPTVFSEDWQEHGAEEWKKAREVQWDASQETVQTLRLNKIRLGYRILLFTNLSLFVFLFFLCPTSVISLKYQLLLIQLLPVSYFIYAWIFNQVMTWLPLSDVNASADWKAKHIGMGFVYIHVGLCMFFVTDMTLSRHVNFVTGEWTLYAGTVLLTVIFLLITIVRTKGMPHRILTPVLTAFFFLIYSLGATLALIMAVSPSSDVTHYPAEAIRMWENEEDYFDDYYAEILLPDGTTAEVSLFHSIYEDLQEGESMVVCDHTGPLGIRFVSVHAPQ